MIGAYNGEAIDFKVIIGVGLLIYNQLIFNHNMASYYKHIFKLSYLRFYLIKLVNWNCILELRCGKVDILQYNNRGLGLSQHS